MLTDRLNAIHRRIHQACQRSGRDPSSVTLVCVTKGVAPRLIREAVAHGVSDIGENRVQEARQKYQELYGEGGGCRVEGVGRSLLHPSPLTLHPVIWHMIGHLQRNKAKEAVELFDVIQSVDSVALAQELNRLVAGRPRALEVFLQVNVSGEATKFGCAPEEALTFAQTVMQLPHLRLSGLMTLAPLADDPEHVRPHFRHLRQLRDEMALRLSLESSALRLSMGMSQDFEVAIEEGADVVRIGTAIFQEGKT